MKKQVTFYLQMKETDYMMYYIKWNAKYTKKFFNFRIIHGLIDTLQRYKNK